MTTNLKLTDTGPFLFLFGLFIFWPFGIIAVIYYALIGYGNIAGKMFLATLIWGAINLCIGLPVLWVAYLMATTPY